jgi:glucuronokinase
MELIRRRAYARAGLIGNPSDGYNGKTISVIVRDFFAEVVLYEWPTIEIVNSDDDQSRFDSIHGLVHDVELHGYYGGIRLVKATIKAFAEYCGREGIELHDRNFAVRYESTIPRQVGLAGSSAIIVATLRTLMDYYNISIPLEVQPSLVLSIETRELGITAGLQDRVIQVYGGVVYMDFSHDSMEDISGFQCGRYEVIEKDWLPQIYIAYSVNVSEPTEVLHNNLRGRFDGGESCVVKAMWRFAELAAEAHKTLATHDPARLRELIDENFDLRQSICQLPEGHVQMIQRAREVGASAKFAGSGGAIIGTYQDESMFADLKQKLGEIGCNVFKPDIGTGDPPH